MGIWYVHRNEAGAIVYASEDLQAGYATEELDDASNAEIQAFRAAATAPRQAQPLEKLRALGLSADDLRQILADGG